jgi:phage terminase large subunit
LAKNLIIDDIPSAWFPEKLKFLFEPHRMKCAYGGRGSGKSWGFARALLLQGYNEPLRILCTREIQKNIKESVHQLLSDQIKELGLEGFYEILSTEIRGQNGTQFYFAGLSEQTASGLKSFEGVNRVWCEEAQSITKRSWQILSPTIRAKDSEIWVTFNPELETDYTYSMFVGNPPPDCISVKLNYSDNKRFPEILEAERTYAKDTMHVADYNWIWEGNCKPAVEGAIYFEQVSQAENEGRICNVPYDPMLKVHLVWDLGWNDAMTIAFVQKSASAIHIIDYIEGNRRTYDDYMVEINAKKYNIGTHFLPHDGFSHDPKSGTTVERILQNLGASVMATPKLGLEQGIDVARMGFRRVYFDKTKTSRLVECLKRYRRNINQSTMEFTTPRHDEFSHGADSFRYALVAADMMTNEDWGGTLSYPSLGVF